MLASRKPKPARGWGWLLRPLLTDYILAAVCFGLLLLLGLGLGALPGWSGGRREFVALTLVFGLSHALAQLFHYLPRGPEQGLSRLGLAAFCRTFLPLLAMLSIHNYIFPLLNQTNCGSMIAAYLVSLGLTLANAANTTAEKKTAGPINRP